MVFIIDYSYTNPLPPGLETPRFMVAKPAQADPCQKLYFEPGWLSPLSHSRFGKICSMHRDWSSCSNVSMRASAHDARSPQIDGGGVPG